MLRDVIASLDIGTATTRCVLTEVNTRGQLRVLGLCQLPSQGVRKGLIIDGDACARIVQETVSSAERMAGLKCGGLHVGLSPIHSTLLPSRSAVPVHGAQYEVNEEDVARVGQAVRMISLPPNREIVDIVPRQYLVDGYGGLKDPLHMVGTRLELDALLVVGSLTALSTIRRTIERAGHITVSFVLKPLALGELLLSPEERASGVQLVDIGAGLTEMAYFEEGGLKAIGVLPVGSASISNDLAIGLKVSLATAEKLKTEVDWFSAPEDQVFDLQAFGHVESRRIHPSDVLRVIEPRIDELMKLISHQGEQMSGSTAPPLRVVLTGGMLKAKAWGKLAERLQCGIVRMKLDATNFGNDPGLHTALAMAAYVFSQAKSAKTMPSGKVKKPIWAAFKGVLQDIWE